MELKVKERDEKKRNVLWKAVTLGATFVILFVAGYFAVGFMTGNPLEGEWVSEEKGYYLQIEDDQEVIVNGIFDGEYIEYELSYSLNKNDKTITIKADAQMFDASADEEGVWTDEDRKSSVENTPVTFEYDLGRNTLTLREREYGQEFVFTKK